MDLNRPPSDTFDLPSTLDIKIICRKKTNCREVLVRKYGEERCNAILRSPDPIVLAAITRLGIIVIFLHN